jgi:hypothetical protein
MSIWARMVAPRVPALLFLKAQMTPEMPSRNSTATTGRVGSSKLEKIDTLAPEARASAAAVVDLAAACEGDTAVVSAAVAAAEALVVVVEASGLVVVVEALLADLPLEGLATSNLLPLFPPTLSLTMPPLELIQARSFMCET